MSAPEWGVLLLLSILWGGSFFFVEVALTAWQPLTIVAVRVAIGAACLWIAALALRWPIPRGQNLWGALLVIGVLNNAVPFTLIVWGQSHIASGLASILNATTPLFTLVAAHAFTRDERMTARGVAGVLVGLAGAAVLIGPTELLELGAAALAQLAVLGAALSYALAAVFGRRFARMGVPPTTTALGQLTAAAAILLPLALALEQPWTLAAPNLPTWAAIVALGTASTALAYVLYFRILATSGATNILLVTFLVPASAILLGTMVLGEVLLPRHIAGMATIGAALAVIDGRALNLLGSFGARRRTAARMADAIYHVCPEAAWSAAKASGSYDGSGDDLRDGFVHFSTAAQVRASVAKHRAGQHGLLLLEVDSSGLGPALRWEPARGGDRFPHLYAPLPLAAVRSARPLPVGDDGAHVFPDGIP